MQGIRKPKEKKLYRLDVKNLLSEINIDVLVLFSLFLIVFQFSLFAGANLYQHRKHARFFCE